MPGFGSDSFNAAAQNGVVAGAAGQNGNNSNNNNNNNNSKDNSYTSIGNAYNSNNQGAYTPPELPQQPRKGMTLSASKQPQQSAEDKWDNWDEGWNLDESSQKNLKSPKTLSGSSSLNALAVKKNGPLGSNNNPGRGSNANMASVANTMNNGVSNTNTANFFDDGFNSPVPLASNAQESSKHEGIDNLFGKPAQKNDHEDWLDKNFGPAPLISEGRGASKARDLSGERGVSNDGGETNLQMHENHDDFFNQLEKDIALKQGGEGGSNNNDIYRSNYGSNASSSGGASSGVTSRIAKRNAADSNSRNEGGTPAWSSDDWGKW